MAYANNPLKLFIWAIFCPIFCLLRCSCGPDRTARLAARFTRRMEQNLIPNRAQRHLNQFQFKFDWAIFCSILSVLAVLLITASTAQAQVRGEALWRAESEAPSQQVPVYDGEPSPFPIKQPPPPPEPEESDQQADEEQAPQLTPEQRIAQQRAERAASLMSRIRDILKADSAFKPDLSGIVIEAVVSGEAGDMALVKNKWFFEGDYIQTPVKTANSLMTLMSGLEQADENLADIVSEEVQTKLAEAGPERVLVRQIENKGMTLRLPGGHTHVISFNSQGW